MKGGSISNMDVIKILELLAAHNLVRLHKVSGSYYQVHCPFHNNGQERRPSCGVLLEDQVRNGRKYLKGSWHCFTCGYAEPMSKAVQDMFDLHPVTLEFRSEIFELIGEDADVEDDALLPDSIIQGLNSKYAIDYIRSQTEHPKTYISDEELASYRYIVPYMYERGLTDELIDRYDIGFDANFIPEGRKRPVPCITFPVRDEHGNTLFIARRSVEGKFFYLPRAIEKPVYGIFELPRNVKSVVITESVFNMTTSVKYGRPAVSLLGTGNLLQIKQLQRLGVQEFILGLDPDEAGRRGSAKLKRHLSKVAIVWEFEGIPEGKDINDLDFDAFSNLDLV